MTSRTTAENARSNYGDLADKGYLVIRRFLDAREIDEFINCFAAQPAPGYETFRVKIPPYPFLIEHIEKFRSVSDDVARATSLRADALTGGVFFFTEGKQIFGWHQDRESYYTWQNHRNYLNFYIPIVKPEPAKSNLSVVPMDRLRDRSPACWEAVQGRGATLFEVQNGTTLMHDEVERRPPVSFDFSLNDLAETPALAAGDLLLLRGDVIHRTQDADTRRVAVSVRFADSRQVLSTSEMVHGGAMKLGLMLNQHPHYQTLLTYLERPGKDSVRVGDVCNPAFGEWRADHPPTSQASLFTCLIRKRLALGLYRDTALLLLDLLRARLMMGR